MENIDEEDASDVEVSDEVESEAPPPSLSRLYREVHEGTRPDVLADLGATRPTPHRHAPAPAPKTPAIQRVSTLYNFGFIQNIPVAEIQSNKKDKRKELEVVEPEQVKVLFL